MAKIKMIKKNLQKFILKMSTSQRILFLKNKHFLIICVIFILFLLISYDSQTNTFLTTRNYQLVLNLSSVKVSKCNQTIMKRFEIFVLIKNFY